MFFICNLPINVFQIYLLISVNELFFAMIYKISVKRASLFILAAHFFVYLFDILGARFRPWKLRSKTLGLYRNDNLAI